jgi:hypothetical protein
MSPSREIGLIYVAIAIQRAGHCLLARRVGDIALHYCASFT